MMGQASNSNRRASLDQKKERAAGRQKTRGYHEGNRDDFDQPQVGRGRVKGAFGKGGEEGLTDSPPGVQSKGGGGGGAQGSISKDMDQPPSSRSAKKR